MFYMYKIPSTLNEYAVAKKILSLLFIVIICLLKFSMAWHYCLLLMIAYRTLHVQMENLVMQLSCLRGFRRV